jgi:hypothetical protein
MVYITVKLLGFVPSEIISGIAKHYSNRGAHRALVGRPDGKRALRRYWHRCEDNIKMDLHEVRWGGIDWIYLAQDRDRWHARVNTAKNFWVSAGLGEFLDWLKTVRFFTL